MADKFAQLPQENWEAVKQQPSFPHSSWLMRQDRSALIGSITSSCKRALWELRKFKALPTPMRVVIIGVAVLAVCSVGNLIYQMLRKPTEVFALIPSEFNKAPIETWRQYAPLFREYSTVSIPPELLAALAQVESAGNPVASTYWRWRLTTDPFAVYQPASSAVGMYQMTDAAFAEAQGYCILHHTVVETGCSATTLHSRVVPRHATELTAVFLDRNITAILGHRRKTRISHQQREELATIIHLCGAGPASAFARRGFHLMPGERCGDHEVAAYLPQINAMKRKFLRLAAER
ncbi:MAG: hypothetical protein WA709_31140 [Stellaceae bacterium]